MSKDTGGPAFPQQGSMELVAKSGMTLRDYFAAEVMAAIWAGDVLKAVPDEAARFGVSEEKHIADVAYSQADAMLAERAK